MEGSAENWLDRDKPDLRGAENSRPQEAKAEPSKDFTIDLTLPARYTSNVASASVDSLIEARGDGHVTPELSLKWSHQYDWAKLSAEVGASLDRYFTVADANSESLYTSFKIQKTDGKSDFFVPYAVIDNSTYFERAFRQTDIAFHDVAGGFRTAIAWRDKSLIPYRDALVPYGDATEPGDVSVLFDARVGRRISDVADYQNTFLSMKAELAYVLPNNWRVEASTKFRARWYENYFSERRTDYRPGASIGLVWAPDWLKKLAKRSELSLNFDMYRNYSNLPEKNYSVWEFGPTLSLRTKF